MGENLIDETITAGSIIIFLNGAKMLFRKGTSLE
jgi:hypothetical protein